MPPYIYLSLARQQFSGVLYEYINKFTMKAPQKQIKIHPAILLKDRKPKNKSRSIENTNEERIDFIENMYRNDKTTGGDNNQMKQKIKSLKRQRETLRTKMSLVASNTFVDSNKDFRPKNNLHIENIQLKKKLSDLQNDHFRTRGNSSKRKQAIIVKKLSQQFEKELYWTGSNSYMISGVKLQYQKMKENYEKKCAQVQMLSQSLQISTNKQILTYIDAIEVENHTLSNHLQNIKSLRKDETQNDKDLDFAELIMKNQKTEKKLEQLKQSNKKLQIDSKNNKKKIQFLQQLIISKDNAEHWATKRAKKLEKELKDLQTKATAIQKSKEEEKSAYQRKISQINQRNYEQYLIEVNQSRNMLKEKQNHIDRLERENSYLKNLLECWKAQKNPEEKVQEPGVKTMRNKQEKGNSMHSQQINVKSEIDRKNSLEHKELLSDYASFNKSKPTNSSTNQIKQKESSSKIEKKNSQIRQQLKADAKHSESSIKNRRVQKHQIDPIIQFYRYVLIYKQIDINNLISLFDGRFASQDEPSQWRSQFISMGEVRLILTQQLTMKNEDAMLLARYLVEDCTTQHVYTDDINEHHRAVVKSIIKSLLGEYDVFREEKKVHAEELLAKYKSKLQWSLQTITKNGEVSQDRFLQIVQTLGIDTKGGYEQYFIAKMAVNSKNLQTLKFGFLF